MSKNKPLHLLLADTALEHAYTENPLTSVCESTKKSRVTPKERGLIKGALRRIFSRSELRRQALAASIVPGMKSLQRPRVTKWSQCPRCDRYEPAYLMEVDHRSPVIPLDKSLEQMTLDELVDRIWCDLSNLIAICKPCHHTKSKQETKERAANKKRNKK